MMNDGWEIAIKINLIKHKKSLSKSGTHQKCTLSTMIAVTSTTQGFRISEVLYIESEKGVYRALQADYLGCIKHSLIQY